MTDQITKVLAQVGYPGNALDVLRAARDIAHACGLRGPDMMSSFAMAGGAAVAAALAGIRSADPDVDGDVVLHVDLDGPQVMDVPTGRRLQPQDWMFGWAAAMITGDAISALTLGTPEVLSALDADDDPTGAALCAALAATQDKGAQLEAFLPAFETDALWVPALHAICDLDAEAFIDAAHTTLLETPSDLGITTQHIVAIALTRLAQDAEVLTLDQLTVALGTVSPEIKASLQTGSAHAPALAEIRWPDRAILSADEARWFFDMRAVPRDTRDHTLVAGDAGQVFAHYTVSGHLAPKGSCRFLLVDTVAEAGTLPMAIDAGALIVLAEMFGQSVSTAVEALDCIDAALARIPDGADTVSADTLTSPVGRALWKQEPGRFRRDRLQAYRGGIAAAVADGAGSQTARPQDPPEDLHDLLTLSTDVLRADVEPILERLISEDARAQLDALQPEPEDFASVFLGDAAAQAKERFAARPKVTPLDDIMYARIDISAAPAGMLGDKNALSAPFPEVFQTIARYLHPGRVWITARYVTGPGDDGVDLNGLVWTGARWIWLPKPWTLLATQ